VKSIFLLIVFFYSQLLASSPINLTNESVNIQDFDLEYIPSENELFDLNRLQKQNFIPQTNRISLGKDNTSVWIKFKVYNTTDKEKKVYLHNELGYMANQLDYYELSNSKITNSYRINFQKAQYPQDKVFGSDIRFDISLQAYEVKDIYIYLRMDVMLFTYFTIYDEKNSLERLSKKNGLEHVILGMMIALSLYHFILYLSTKYKAYIFYTLYLVSATIWEAQISGMLSNNFNFYFQPQNELLLLSVVLIPIFLVYFAKTIFNTAKKYKTENVFLNLVIIVQMFALVIAIFHVNTALSLMTDTYILMFTILFFVTFSIMKKGNKLAPIFLIANSIFAIFTLITDLYYMGVLQYTRFVYISATIGILIEAIMLALIISYRIKLYQVNEIEKVQELTKQSEMESMNKLLQARVEKQLKTSREKDKILFQQTKMVSMGEMLQNIAHQWRQPLAEVNASVLVIDNILYEKYNDDASIQKELSSIERLTSYMSKTIDSFREFFDNQKEITHFFIKDSLNNALSILERTFETNGIVVEVNIKDEYMIETYDNELQQVLLVLLNNAKDAFISNKTIHPRVFIDVQAFDDKYRISVCDNAGGIDYAIIDRIFEPYFTTKQKSQGTGLGLYISRMIIEDNMNGQLNVKNTIDGVCFNIILNKKLINE